MERRLITSATIFDDKYSMRRGGVLRLRTYGCVHPSTVHAIGPQILNQCSLRPVPSSVLIEADEFLFGEIFSVWKTWDSFDGLHTSTAQRSEFFCWTEESSPSFIRFHQDSSRVPRRRDSCCNPVSGWGQKRRFASAQSNTLPGLGPPRVPDRPPRL
jgi:hypothetical protein